MTEFDPIRYKAGVRERWEAAAEPWHRWTPVLEAWLGTVTTQMLDMARFARGSRVLDVAAGTGLQTLAAARRVGPEGHVVAIDLSPASLRFAAARAREAGFTHVATQEMDGESLDQLPEASFDAAICRLGLMLMADPQKAMAGMRRALKPGGRAAAIVFSTAEKNLFLSLPQAIARRRSQLPLPRPGEPGPFSLGSSDRVRELYQAAGFRDVETRIAPAPLRMTSAADCFRFERESFGALHQMLANLSEEQRQAAWDEIAETLRQFDGPGGFESPCEVILSAGTK